MLSGLERRVRNLAEFEMLSSTPYVWVNKDRRLVESSFVTYRDETGHVGTIVVRKKTPTLEDVKAAVKERMKGKGPA